MSKKGELTYLLGLDCETTGVAGGCDDPSYNPKTGETYQAISWGLVVVDSKTFKQKDSLYVEIKWDQQSTWNSKTENVHGLTKSYLDQNGLDQEDAVVEIGSFILKYFDNTAIVPIGHNVHFDVAFMRSLMRLYDIDIRFANRMVDTNSLGLTLVNSFTSDELFEKLGYNDRDCHNALEDIKMTVEAARAMKLVFDVGWEKIHHGQ